MKSSQFKHFQLRCSLGDAVRRNNKPQKMKYFTFFTLLCNSPMAHR